MPNARIVFDDNVQVISPVAEAMARLGKTLAYDIPKMEMEREDLNYRRQVQADETSYRRGRDAIGDQRYDEGVKLQADETSYRRGRDSVGDQRYDDNLTLTMAEKGVAPPMTLAPTPVTRAGWKIAADANADRTRKQGREAVDDMLKLSKPGVAKTEKLPVVIPREVRDAAVDRARRQSFEHGALRMNAEGKDEFARAIPAAEDGTGGKPGFADPEARAQWFEDNSIFEAGYNPRTLRMIETPEELSQVRSDLESRYSKLQTPTATGVDNSAVNVQVGDDVVSVESEIGNIANFDYENNHPILGIDPDIVDRVRPDWSEARRKDFKEAFKSALAENVAGDKNAKKRYIDTYIQALLKGSPYEQKLSERLSPAEKFLNTYEP